MRASGRHGHGFVFQPKRIAGSQTVERSVGEEGQLEDKEIDGNLNNKTIIKIHPPQIRILLEDSAPREIRRTPIDTRVCSVSWTLEPNTAITIKARQQLDVIGFRGVLKKDVGMAV